MSRLELRHLRYVVAVAEERSFRRGAERLHLSQPPLSRQIREVEGIVGTPLFERKKSGVTLTPAGAAFLPEARRTLAQAETAINAARAAPGSQPSLTVGLTTIFDTDAFPAVIEAFEKRFPKVRLVVKRKPSIQLVRDVENGLMDAALIGLHTEVRTLHAETLQEEPVVAALSAKHPLARKRVLQLAELQKEPLFRFDRRLNPGYHDHCSRVFAQWGFSPLTLPEPADHHVLLGLVAAGQGITLMASSKRRIRRPGVVFRQLRATPVLTMGLALVHAPTRISTLCASFIGLVHSVAGRAE